MLLSSQTSPRLLPSARTQSCSFSARLIGGPSEALHRPVTSPYTARLLKPFIRRDFESRPLKLRLLEQITEHKNRRVGEGRFDIGGGGGGGGVGVR